MKMNRLWIILGLLFTVLVTALGYFALNFVGIGPVPLRSAFSGRLPSVAEDPSRFQFFYATNRENNAETFDDRGNVLGNNLLTGVFDVNISPYLPIVPFVWFDSLSMKWTGRKELSNSDFNEKLRLAVKDSPQKSLLIVVWGFRDWFQSAALKTAYTGYVLDINTPILLFDWPGNQGEGRQGYRASQEMATLSAETLGRLIADAVLKTGAENVWLMGSSLGCQTIVESLSWLSTQKELTQSKPILSNVIFSAPDVSANAFDEKFAKNIQQLSEHFTAYVSSNDRALLMSQWINGSRRLGRLAEVTTLPEERKGEYEFEEALELLDLQQKGARNFFVIDATPINRTRNLHHFFTDSPEFFDDLYQHLLSPSNIVNRRLHIVRTAEQGREYRILWSY